MLLCNSNDPGESGNANDSIFESQSDPAGIIHVLLHLYSGFSVSSLWHFSLFSINTTVKGRTATGAAGINLYNYKKTYHTRFQILIKKKNPVKSPICNDQVPYFSCNLHALSQCEINDWILCCSMILPHKLIANESYCTTKYVV